MSGQETQRRPLAPTRKVGAGALGGALATVAVWLMAEIGDADVSAGVEGALAVIGGFILSYLVPEREIRG